MGMLSRLFRSRESPAPAPAVADTGPAPQAVLVPDDLAAQLTAEGQPLQEAVERALRRALEPARTEAKPFWVERGEPSGDLSDELRDRVAQRRAAELEP